MNKQKIKNVYRGVAFVIALLMILGTVFVASGVSVKAATTNYALGKSYTSSSSSYASNLADSGSLLTNGVVGTTETSGVTVGYAGTGTVYTLVFDLGEIRYDIKTIKFMNVYVSSNRGFDADAVTISVYKESKGDANTYTYDSVVQHSTNYFNYTYTLSTEAIGRYVAITMRSPVYVLSLSEIEIWGSGNPAVDDEDETPTVTNYAKGNSYVVPAVSYNTGFSDSGSLLTDGNIALSETSGVTVAYAGTNKSYTLIFDLGATRDDIKTVKFRNVCVSGNRNFSQDKVIIAVTDSQNSSEPVGLAYTSTKETQSGSTYFDFTYTLNAEVSGRYVYITMHTSGYILSLSEIEIYSAPQSNSSIVIPDPIDTTPKFDISLSCPTTFKKGQTVEVLCTIKNITATYGIVAVDFAVKYNVGAFTPVYPSGDDLSANYIKTAPKENNAFLWEDIGTYCDTKNGIVYMRFAHKTAENGDGTKANGELVFKITFTANLSSGTYSFEATNCRGTDPGSANNKKLTEVYANGSSCSSTAVVVSTSGLVSTDSKVTVANGYIYGLPIGLTSTAVASKFEGSVTVTSNGIGNTVTTGDVVTAENGEKATVIVAGDVDGSGELDATDYVVIKKCFLGDTTLEGNALLSADTDRSGEIDSTDYIRVKSHFLGKASLY